MERVWSESPPEAIATDDVQGSIPTALPASSAGDHRGAFPAELDDVLMDAAPPLPVDPPTLQEEQEQLGIDELRYGRDSDESPSRSPERFTLDEQEKSLRMHATNAEWVLTLRRCI